MSKHCAVQLRVPVRVTVLSNSTAAAAAAAAVVVAAECAGNGWGVLSSFAATASFAYIKALRVGAFVAVCDPVT